MLQTVVYLVCMLHVQYYRFTCYQAQDSVTHNTPCNNVSYVVLRSFAIQASCASSGARQSSLPVVLDRMHVPTVGVDRSDGYHYDDEGRRCAAPTRRLLHHRGISTSLRCRPSSSAVCVVVVINVRASYDKKASTPTQKAFVFTVSAVFFREVQYVIGFDRIKIILFSPGGAGMRAPRCTCPGCHQDSSGKRLTTSSANTTIHHSFEGATG